MRVPRVRSIRRWIFGVLILLVAYYAVQSLLRTPPLTATQVAAHRGGADLAPENTMAAFHNAIGLGVDWLELDVQLSRDGELIVIHDETVDRTTDGTGAVRDLALADIRALDAGNGEHPPTAQEVIALAKSAGLQLLIETKSPHLYPGVEEKLLRALSEADYQEQTVIQSFSDESLATLRQINPEIKLCALYGLWEFDVSQPAGAADTICPMAEMVLLNPNMIRQAHQAGRPVFIWFGLLENEYTLRNLRFFGADGFMVDDPSVALPIVRDSQPSQ